MRTRLAPMLARLLVLTCALAMSACALPAQSHAGKHLKLETIRHDWQTTYQYRWVPDEPVRPKP